jgi:hypothetical protein
MALCASHRLRAAINLEKAVFLCVIGLGFTIPHNGPSGWFPLAIPGAMAENIVFPADAGIVNVRTFGVVGDGTTDDTAAIQRVIDSLKGRQTLYFPNGTYLVSDTLIYPKKGRSLITQGQSRDGTIIRLKNGAAGFDDPNNPKPVIQTRDGNRAFGYRFLNLTIDIGSRNPGASGIDYISNNNGAISAVRILSSDPAKQGARGIDMSRPWPGPALIKNVQIEGFDYGLYLDRTRYSMAIEHLTLQDQRKVGIRNLKNTIAVRGLTSSNTVPVIQNRAGTVTVVDGEFRGGSPSISAIEHDGLNRGVLFARNIVASGYRSAIKSNGEVISGTSISEYTSEPPRRLFSPANQRSLDLRVEETPDISWGAENNFEEWVNVTDFGARPDDGKDDSDAVQQAIDTANKKEKATIYLPYGEYHFTKTIRIWGSIRRVLGMMGLIRISEPLLSVKGPVFRLEQGQDVVVFERLFIRPDKHKRNEKVQLINHATVNTVVFKYGGGGIYRNSITGGRAFFEDWTSYFHITGPQKVWIRQWNPETGASPRTRAVNVGGMLWILMMKTEGHGVHVENKNGGRVEILGMFTLISGDTDAYSDFINDEAQLSMSGVKPIYKRVVVETRQGKTATLYNEKPSRFPLYVGW